MSKILPNRIKFIAHLDGFIDTCYVLLQGIRTSFISPPSIALFPVINMREIKRTLSVHSAIKKTLGDLNL